MDLGAPKGRARAKKADRLPHWHRPWVLEAFYYPPGFATSSKTKGRSPEELPGPRPSPVRLTLLASGLKFSPPRDDNHVDGRLPTNRRPQSTLTRTRRYV